MKNEYEWLGLPVTAEFGYCVVSISEGSPSMWYHFECETMGDNDKTALIPAVMVRHKYGDFCISNHFGIGILRLKQGGLSGYRSFTLPVEGFKPWKPKVKVNNPTHFDLPRFMEHEHRRRAWEADKIKRLCEQLDQIRKYTT